MLLPGGSMCDISGLATGHQLVSNEQEFAQLKDQWEEVHQSSNGSTFFNSWAWMKAWWETYAEPSWCLQIYLFTEGDEVIGILPLYARTDRRLAVRCLCYLGTGEKEEEEAGTEYADILIRAGWEPQVFEKVKIAFSGKDVWDVMRLPNVLQESNLYQLVQKAKASGCRVREQQDGVRYFVSLPSSTEDYLLGLSKNFRKKAAYYQRQLSQRGYRLQTWTSPLPDDAMQRLVALHEKRWTHKGGAGVFAIERFRQFHQILGRYLNGRYVAAVSILAGLGDIAALYSFSDGKSVYFYQSGIDSSQLPSLSPGVAIILWEIERAIKGGSCVFDFMKGEPGSYKEKYGTSQAAMSQITLYRRTLRGRTAYLLSTVKMRIRSLIRRQVK